MMVDLQKDRVVRAYGRWAPVYDLLFGRVSAPVAAQQSTLRKTLAAASWKSASAPGFRSLATPDTSYSAWTSRQKCCAKHANG